MAHCMIVDRSNVVRKVAKRILQTPEMAVVEADNGYDALEMCRASMPSTILIDIGLPNESAMQLVAEIRSITSKTRPTILMTMAQLDLVAMTKAKRVGADDYLLKPFDRRQLLGSFREAQPAKAA